MDSQAKRVKLDTPSPGIHEDVPFADYLRWDAVNNSLLSEAMKSMAHFRYAQTAPPQEQKPHFQLGTLTHAGRLEPLSIPRLYAVMPPYHLDEMNVTGSGASSTSKGTAWYKEKAAAFEEANGGKEIVEQSTFDDMLALVTALSNNERARKYLGGDGPVEVCIVWEDPTTGLLCKARVDKWKPRKLVISDLKTTQNLRKFQWAMSDYGYARQGAWYRRGIKAATGEDHDFVISAVEKSPPHCCQTAPIGEDSLDVADGQIAKLLVEIRDCMDSGEWPGYEDPKTWELPERELNSEAIPLIMDGKTVLV